MWLEAALFYVENFTKFKLVPDSLDNDAVSISKRKKLFSNPDELIKELRT